MKDHFEAMMRGQTHPAGQHTRERWAQNVVGDLLRKDPPIAIRRGNLAEIMWWMSAILPSWVHDWIFWQSCKFGEFTAKLNALESKKAK